MLMTVAARRIMWLIALSLSLAAVFQTQISTGFTVLTGDRLDGLIETSILEHWYNVFRGLAAWDTTNYFAPHRGTLAYNDGYMLYGVWHSLFRSFGIDAFLSAELVNVVFRIVGFVAAYALSWQVLRLGSNWSLLAAVLFTITSSTFQQSYHAQLLSVALVPLNVWLMVRTAESLIANRRMAALAWGVTAALLYAAWLLTAFYMAWFLAFYALICLLVLPLTNGIDTCCQGLLVMRRQMPILLLILAVLVVGVTPFLHLYLPRAAETGMHGFAGVSVFLGTPAGILNTGPHNLMFGGFMQWLAAAYPDMFPAGEHLVGISPILLSCFVVSAVWCWRHTPALRAPIAAIVIFWLLTIKVGDVSPWTLIYQVFPGAKAVRVVVRSYIFLAGPITAITLVGLSGMFRGRAWAPQMGLCLLLVIEQLSTAPVAGLDRAEEQRRLAALPTPPAECRTFAAMVAREGNLASNSEILSLYSHNVDAMLIAELTNIPTINGFSTFNPPDWNFNNAWRSDYPSRVEAYANQHRIEGLCGLDLDKLRWDLRPKSNPVVPLTPLTQITGVSSPTDFEGW